MIHISFRYYGSHFNASIFLENGRAKVGGIGDSAKG